MPRRNKKADEAYERIEDQRALVAVLDAAHLYSINLDDIENGQWIAEIDAAIARVMRAFVRISTADAQASLHVPPDAFDPPRDLGTPMADAFEVPARCPKCDAEVNTVRGGRWSPLHGSPYTVQCDACGHQVQVSQQQYEAVQAERRAAFGDSDRSLKRSHREPRTRGAG